MNLFLATFLSLPVIAGWLLMMPLGGAYLEGLRSARDPSHRLTPRSPWFFFDRTVRRRIESWRWIWTAAYLLALPLPFLLVLVEPEFWSGGLSVEKIGICVMVADIGLSTGLLTYTGFLLLAPRFNELRWLMLTCLGASLFVLSPILFAASIVILRALSDIHAHALRIFTFGFAFFPAQVLVLALALRFWARARGDHWFRIGDSRREFPAAGPTGNLTTR